jgi:hypothetical protein
VTGALQPFSAQRRFGRLRHRLGLPKPEEARSDGAWASFPI